MVILITLVLLLMFILLAVGAILFVIVDSNDEIRKIRRISDERKVEILKEGAEHLKKIHDDIHQKS